MVRTNVQNGFHGILKNTGAFEVDDRDVKVRMAIEKIGNESGVKTPARDRIVYFWDSIPPMPGRNGKTYLFYQNR